MKNRITLFLIFSFSVFFVKATTTLDSITHITVSCNDAGSNNFTNGAIYISTTVFNAQYNWVGPFPYSSNNQDITGIAVPGQYTVYVKDDKGNLIETATFSLGYYTDYSYFSGVDEVIVNNRPALKNISGSNNWCRGAGSRNVLAGGTDGWAEYKATVTTTHRIFGFSEYLTTSHCWGYMQYGVYLKNNGYLYRVISGSQTYIGTYAVNDMIRVARVGTNLVVYKNNVAIDTYSIGTTGQNKDLLFEASIYSANGLLENIGLSFKPPMDLDILVNNVPCGETSGGTITVTPCGSGYSYSWSHGPTTATVDNLAVGTYDVTITDGNGWMVKKEISVGYDVNWVNTYNVSTPSDNLINSGGSGITWDAGANSDVKLSANTDGWVEYEIVGLDKERALGLTQSPVSTHPLVSIDYGMILHDDATGQKTLSGTVSGIMGTFKKGEILRIAREGSNIYCYRDGFKMLLISSVNASEELYAEASFFSLNGVFEHVRSSLYCSIRPYTYAKVKKELDASYVFTSNEFLYFEYFEEYTANHNLKFKVYSFRGDVLYSDSDLAVNVPNTGVNRLKIDFSVSGICLNDGMYYLEVENEKGEKKYLRFKKMNSASTCPIDPVPPVSSPTY